MDLKNFNSQQLVAKLSVIAGCIIAGLVGTVIVGAAEDNPVITSLILSSVACVLTAVVSPKIGLYLFFIQCAYLDLIKRLAIVISTMSMLDVYKVLALAPLTFLGILLGIIIRHIMRIERLERRDWFLLSITTAVAVIAVVLGWIQTGVLGEAVATAANNIAYLPFMVVVPRVVRDIKGLASLLLFVIIAFVPVAFYGIYQWFMGIFEFERQYMLSGLTTISYHILDDVNLRPFSTLSSPFAFGLVMATLTLLCFYLARHGRALGMVHSALPWWGPTILFATGMIFSFYRTAWICCGFGLFCSVMLRSAKRARYFYAFFGLALILIVTQADVILENLDLIQSIMPSGDSAAEQQAFRLGTFTPRLEGMINLTSDGSLFSWFGFHGRALLDIMESHTTHDLFTDLYLRIGIVGLLLFLALLIFVVGYFQHLINTLRGKEERILSATFLSVLVAIILGGVTSGSVFGVFPMNAFIWFSVGTVLMINDYSRAKDLLEPAEGEASAGRTRPIHLGPAESRLPRPLHV